MEKSESIKELAIALCKFQGAIEKVKRTETNPFFGKKYADLSSILDVIQKPLADSGLSFVQFPKGKYELETMLMHESGEWISGCFEMVPTKNDPQGAGSVITYQRRYALGAVLGINIDTDDDGNAASAPPKTKTIPPAIVPPAPPKVIPPIPPVKKEPVKLIHNSTNYKGCVNAMTIGVDDHVFTLDDIKKKYIIDAVTEELLLSDVAKFTQI